MEGEFERATRVRSRGGGLYDADIPAGWDIAGNANGGYLIALAARAMIDATGRPPLSLTAHYLAPGRPGPCDVSVDLVRVGRRTATASARLRSHGVDSLALLGTFGEQGAPGPLFIGTEPPDLPPIDQCVRAKPPGGEAVSGFGDRVVVRIDPADAGFRLGEPSGRPEISGWFEFTDHQRTDELGLLLVADAFAPVCFNVPSVPVGWTPTLELTVHVRGVPEPGPLRCRFRSRCLQAGLFEEDGEIWDAGGALVAQSRQLALLPRG
ncbi:MAG: thioesterase family protein [Ilumatobacter sp.]|uniref:thioesterase family protein n=1 Tax=Ilumatobacter sp. TaxID=1967498 RepID=UPI002633F8DE|nr:thioesterase family protein [Ilumatobacter sp.]MDJ0768837.1 thioesterase family protein [Ilumatobacter sp.]